MPRRYRARRTRRRPMRRRRTRSRRRSGGFLYKFQVSRNLVTDPLVQTDSFYAIALYPNASLTTGNHVFTLNESRAWVRLQQSFTYIKPVYCKVSFQPILYTQGGSVPSVVKMSSATFIQDAVPTPTTKDQDDLLARPDYKETGPNRTHSRGFKLAGRYPNSFRAVGQDNNVTTWSFQRYLYVFLQTRANSIPEHMGVVNITWWVRCSGILQ